MSDQPQGALPCSAADPLLNQYVDGELDADEQPALFGHLSACPRCRQTFESVLAFRRMSRQEHLAVPPAADEEFLEALSERRQQVHERVDRQAARRPFWTVRAPITLRTALAAVLLVFMTGLIFPSRAGPESASDLLSADPPPATDPALQTSPSPVYIFYPGLTVEATRFQEISAKDPS